MDSCVQYAAPSNHAAVQAETGQEYVRGYRPKDLQPKTAFNPLLYRHRRWECAASDEKVTSLVNHEPLTVSLALGDLGLLEVGA